PRPGVSRGPGAPQRVAGEGQLSGQEDEDEERGDDRDQLDRCLTGVSGNGTSLFRSLKAPHGSISAASLHAPKLGRRTVRVARASCRDSLGSAPSDSHAQYRCASVQTRTIATTESAIRPIQTSVPPPVASISSAAAIMTTI